MSSPTTPRAGHIGGYVGICTSGLSNPHPLGGFRLNNPWLTDKRSLLFWKRTSLNFVVVMQEVLPWKLIALFRLPDKVWRCTINTVLSMSIPNNYMICTHAYLHVDSRNVLITNPVPPRGVLWQNSPTNPPTLPARGVVGHNNDRCISIIIIIVLTFL